MKFPPFENHAKNGAAAQAVLGVSFAAGRAASGKLSEGVAASLGEPTRHAVGC